MMENSSTYRNSRYGFDAGWSMSGSMLPNSVNGSDSPINPSISSIGTPISVVLSTPMVVMEWKNHPYSMCCLNPLTIIVLYCV